MTRSSTKLLLSVAGVLAGIVVVFLLVMHSAKSARATPYVLPAEAGGAWTLTLEPASRPNDALIVLRPPLALTSSLFDQTFKRSMESMQSADSAGIALVLQGELERAGGDRVTRDELFKMARDAGLEGTPPVPVCLAHRRLPDSREQVYFAIFDSPAFGAFRNHLAGRLPTLDAAFVTPAMFVGIVDSSADRWRPLRGDAQADCMAPLSIAQK